MSNQQTFSCDTCNTVIEVSSLLTGEKEARAAGWKITKKDAKCPAHKSLKLFTAKCAMCSNTLGPIWIKANSSNKDFTQYGWHSYRGSNVYLCPLHKELKLSEIPVSKGGMLA